MIHFNNVYKTFRLDLGKKVAAVQGLTLSINQGNVLGCIGPNGAGKSTTIKLLLDLIRPDSGTITINDLPVSNEQSRAKIGYLPENPYIYDYLTAQEYLTYAASLAYMSSAAIKQRSQELLVKLKLEHASDRKISGFSKGMQQRTAIAAALIHNPDLIILDEPMSGLDPLGRKLVFDLIADLRQQGKTVFISSHVLTDIERLCDRVAIVVQGKLCFEERVSELAMSLDDIFLQVVEQAGIGEVR